MTRRTSSSLFRSKLKDRGPGPSCRNGQLQDHFIRKWYLAASTGFQTSVRDAQNSGQRPQHRFSNFLIFAIVLLSYQFEYVRSFLRDF